LDFVSKSKKKGLRFFLCFCFFTHICEISIYTLSNFFYYNIRDREKNAKKEALWQKKTLFSGVENFAFSLMKLEVYTIFEQIRSILLQTTTFKGRFDMSLICFTFFDMKPGFNPHQWHLFFFHFLGLEVTIDHSFAINQSKSEHIDVYTEISPHQMNLFQTHLSI
jgi:hypothetical protein